MANIKVKAKNFWEDHKTEICIVGGIVAMSVGAGVWAYKIYTSGYNWGNAVGFHATLDWLDKTFPEESKARELYEAYAKANPDKIMCVSSSGKVVNG